MHSEEIERILTEVSRGACSVEDALLLLKKEPFTDLGYASTLVSGWGLGLLAQHYGWDVAVGALILIAVVGTLIFMAAWTAKANGYDEGN